MKRIYKIAVIVVAAVLLAFFSAGSLVILANRVALTDEDIRTRLSKHASSKQEALDWFEAVDQSFSDIPLTEPEKRDLRSFSYNLWGTGIMYDDVKNASSMIDVSFKTRGEVPAIFYGKHQLRCWLLFDANGQLVLSKFESLYL